MTQTTADDLLIQLFVKAPVPGLVKTRLAADIGDALAAEFARLQFETLLKELSDAFHVECWVAGDLQHPAFVSPEMRGIQCYQQQGDSLGDKMMFSVRDGLQRARQVIVIGSDCSGLNPALLHQAHQALSEHDMVFVPADDGGFVLWGSCVDCPSIFDGVAWGETSVWHQVRVHLTAQSINVGVLATSWDLDTMDDLRLRYEELPKPLRRFVQENALLPC
ncbi:MAG: TIGR04282 family arsenosugar biosynthesis glycosyltransferase [Pseudomonadota bacterium]